MIKSVKCGGCGGRLYTVNMRKIEHTVNYSEIRLRCCSCGSIAFLTPSTNIEMDWTGEGCPTETGDFSCEDCGNDGCCEECGVDHNEQ